MTEPNQPVSAVEKLAAREAAREAKRAEFEEQRAAQRLLDLDALDALILEHGEVDVDLVTLDVALPAGQPTMIVAKCPGEYEVKQYRHVAQPRKDGRNREIPGDPGAAADLIAETCVLYPTGDALAKLYAARPGVKHQIGVMAVNLTVGRKEAVGKE